MENGMARSSATVSRCIELFACIFVNWNMTGDPLTTKFRNGMIPPPTGSQSGPGPTAAKKTKEYYRDMSKSTGSVQFKIDGLLKLKKVGDFLKLRDKEVKLVLKRKETTLKTRKISGAYVVDLSDMGSHLILKNVRIKRYFFFASQVEAYNLPINNILTIQILNN